MPAAVEDVPTLLADALQSLEVITDCSFIDERSHERIWRKGRSDVHLSIRGDQAIGHLVGDVSVQEQTAQRCAALTSCSDSSEQARAQNEIEIRIVHDDNPVVTA